MPGFSWNRLSAIPMNSVGHLKRMMGEETE